jgi:transcriptional regulator with XRE-family HTH domain
MQRTLGDYLKEKREASGLNQTELSKRAGVPRETVNRIENDKTQLPFADTRRRLAKALGVSHLQLLIAAGEITEQEIAATGAVGVIERDPNDRRERLIQRIREMPDGFGVDEGLEVALGVLEAAVKRGREGKGV